MSETFRAYVVDEKDGVTVGGIRELSINDLPDEKVLVDVQYSSLNYKDGLAVTGKGKVVRRFPMVCGIDAAGTVAKSSHPDFKPGDAVVAMGEGLSETCWGGYSEKLRIDPALLTKLPPGFSLHDAMAVGTAGYTAMLAVMALENAGVTPDRGDVLVTGAGGGVGSIAIAVLADLGYRVVASTGRPQTHDYLKSLGASDFIARADLDRPAKPLDRERWAGTVDSVGGRTLATVLSQTKQEGAVAACGLADGAELPATVIPFILRAVKLLGINYFPMSRETRQTAWQRLARDLDRAKLATMTRVAPMSDLRALAEKILRGETRGRIVIDVRK